jgi:hypothetical protein
MKYLIVAGDSFCASPSGWPQQLANQLSLKLISYGQGGQHWWGVRNFLTGLSTDVLDNSVAMVLAHTNADRIPNLNLELGRVDITNLDPQTDIEKSVYYYYKHIHDPAFMYWAQAAWFKELASQFADKKIIHLHSFPWTLPLTDSLLGTAVVPSLMSISLNELGSKSMTLFNDVRLNHLNTANNQELARQLGSLITNYTTGPAQLDLTKFVQLIDYWTD